MDFFSDVLFNKGQVMTTEARALRSIGRSLYGALLGGVAAVGLLTAACQDEVPTGPQELEVDEAAHIVWGPDVQVMCLGDPIPEGWIQIEYGHSYFDCPEPEDHPPLEIRSPKIPNLIYVRQYSDKPMGSKMAVCKGAPIPEGWMVTKHTIVSCHRHLGPGGDWPNYGREIQRASIDQGILRKWTFDFCRETDITGNPVNISCEPSPRGAAYSLNGTNDYFPTLLSGNQLPLTVATWFRADDVSAEHSIVDSDNAFFWGHSLIIGYWDGDATLDVQYHDGYYDSPFIVTPGQWYHAVATWVEGEVALYVNGQLIGRQKHPVSPLGLDGTGFRFGRHNFGDLQWFKGAIDEVTIWNWALTAEQAAQVYLQ